MTSKCKDYRRRLLLSFSSRQTQHMATPITSSAFIAVYSTRSANRMPLTFSHIEQHNERHPNGMKDVTWEHGRWRVFTDEWHITLLFIPLVDGDENLSGIFHFCSERSVVSLFPSSWSTNFFLGFLCSTMPRITLTFGTFRTDVCKRQNTSWKKELLIGSLRSDRL